MNPTQTSSETPEKRELPKIRNILIPLSYKEPKFPITSRFERRMIAKDLLATAKIEIDKHLKEVGATFGKKMPATAGVA